MKNKVIHGDCLEVMKEMEDNSVDCVITSPPYDNLRTYNGSFDWSFDTFKSIAKELSRVIKKLGVIVWVVGDATINGSETGTSFRQALYFKDECGLNIHDTMIYEKDGLAYPDTNRYYQKFEYMFILSKGKPSTTNLIQDRLNACRFRNAISGGERGINGDIKDRKIFKKVERNIKQYGVRWNIWKYGVGWNKSYSEDFLKGHPAIFPEKLAEDHILTWSNKGDTILDPFAGSGTTGKIAKLNNRNYILIEKEKKYIDIINKRLDNTTISLFN